MSEPRVMSAASRRRRTGAQGSLPEKACEADSMGLLLRLFFFIGAIKKTNTPTVMRRHREDIFHTTCTAYTTPDPRDPSIPLRSTRDDSFRCHVERRGLGPEVETSRRCRTSASADRNGSRSSDRRDSSTMPAASLGMTKKTAESNLSAGSFIVY